MKQIIFVIILVLLATITTVVYAATETADIAVAGDDGQWNSSTLDLGSANLNAGNVSGTPTHTIWRFDGVTIPNGQTITSASIDTTRFRCDAGTTLRISGVDEADPLMPQTVANADGRTLTTAFTIMTCEDPIDVTSVIQELYDSYDYSTNAAILIFAKNDGSINNNFLGSRAFEEAPTGTKDAVLTINYSIPPTPTPTPTSTPTPTPTLVPTPEPCEPPDCTAPNQPPSEIPESLESFSLSISVLALIFFLFFTLVGLRTKAIIWFLLASVAALILAVEVSDPAWWGLTALVIAGEIATAVIASNES